MSKKTITGILFFLLMVFGLYFFNTASNGFCLGDHLLNKLGLKAWEVDERKLGLHYTVFYGLGFIIIGLWGAGKYLKDSYPKLVKNMLWVFLALLLFIVPATTEAAKNQYYSFQNGVKAVEYHAKESKCRIKTEGEKQKVSGTIVLTNYSKKELTVSVKLIDKELFYEELVLKNDQNQKAYVLRPKHKNTLKFEFYIDKGQTILHDGQATLSGPKIELVERG